MQIEIYKGKVLIEATPEEARTMLKLTAPHASSAYSNWRDAGIADARCGLYKALCFVADNANSPATVSANINLGAS